MAEIIKTERHVITSVLLDFATFDETYRRIRRDFHYQGFECFNCGRAFRTGEPISIAFVAEDRNRVVCQACGQALQAELKTTEVS